MDAKNMHRTEVMPRLGPHPSWDELRAQSRSLCLAWSDLAGRSDSGSSERRDATDARRLDEYAKSDLFFKF